MEIYLPLEDVDAFLAEMIQRGLFKDSVILFGHALKVRLVFVLVLIGLTLFLHIAALC